MQNRATREYSVRYGWTITVQVKKVESGAAQRAMRKRLMESVRPGRSTWSWSGA